MTQKIKRPNPPIRLYHHRVFLRPLLLVRRYPLAKPLMPSLRKASTQDNGVPSDPLSKQSAYPSDPAFQWRTRVRRT